MLHFVLISSPSANKLTVSNDEKIVNEVYEKEIYLQLWDLNHGEKIEIIKIENWEISNISHGVVIKNARGFITSIIVGTTSKYKLTDLMFRLAKPSKPAIIELNITEGESHED